MAKVVGFLDKLLFHECLMKSLRTSSSSESSFFSCSIEELESFVGLSITSSSMLVAGFCVAVTDEKAEAAVEVVGE